MSRQFDSADSPLNISRLSQMSTTTPLPGPTPAPQQQTAKTPQPQEQARVTPAPQQRTPVPQNRTPVPQQQPVRVTPAPQARSPYPQTATPVQTVIVKKVPAKKPEPESDDDDDDKDFLSNLAHGDFGFSCNTFASKLACVIVEQLILLIICLPMIVVGATHLTDCPVRSFIPIWLLVAGIFWMLHALINGVLKCGGLVDMEEAMSKSRRMTLVIINVIFGIVQLLWLIAGAITVYGVKSVSYSSSAGTLYCAELVYLYTWWLITLILISVFGGLLIALFFFYCLKTC